MARIAAGGVIMKWQKKTRRRQPAGDQYIEQLKRLYRPNYITAIRESFDNLVLMRFPRFYGRKGGAK